MTRRRIQKHLDVMPPDKKGRLPSTTLTETEFEINNAGQVLMVRGKPLLTNMNTTTPKIQVNIRRSMTVSPEFGKQTGRTLLRVQLFCRTSKSYIHKTTISVIVHQAFSAPMPQRRRQSGMAVSCSKRPAITVSVEPIERIAGRHES